MFIGNQKDVSQDFGREPFLNWEVNEIALRSLTQL